MQNITMKTQDLAIRTPLKTGGEIECSGRVAVPFPLVTPVVLNDTLLFIQWWTLLWVTDPFQYCIQNLF